MNAKYADVVKTSEVLTYLDSLPGGMFNLPAGTAVPSAAPKRVVNF
jgi:hypothetical protein